MNIHLIIDIHEEHVDFKDKFLRIKNFPLSAVLYSEFF